MLSARARTGKPGLLEVTQTVELLGARKSRLWSMWLTGRTPSMRANSHADPLKHVMVGEGNMGHCRTMS